MYTIDGKSDRNHLLTQFAPMVKRIAFVMKAKLPACVETDDLVQAGMIGLLDAISRYDESFGAQFETYAGQRVRGAMLDELRKSDWLPRTLRQNMRKIEDAMHRLEQRLGRPPSEMEVAKELNVSLNGYQEMLGDGVGHQLLYYEDFHDAESSEHFLDRHCVDEGSDPLQKLLDSGFRDALIEAIKALPEREKILMGLYYEQEMNLQEIGAIMGVSESRVCQLRSQAIARLRTSLREKEWTGVA